MPGGDSKSPTGLIPVDTCVEPVPPATPAPSLPVLKPACPGSVTIAPRVLIKEENATRAATGIVTQKEWVIPPRPKPGRKPATDTPPTKRKAQNRAAQRAFRERRAARVHELEDQLKKVESEAAERENSYRDQVSRITAENKLLKETVSELRRDLEQLRRLKDANTTLTQVASPAPSSNTDHMDALYDRNSSSRAIRTAQRPVPTRTSSESSTSSRLIEIDDEDFSSSPAQSQGGCCGGRKCGREGGECNASSFSNSCSRLIQLQKRPKSPNDTDNSKRPRFGPDLETDFTNTFMSSARRTRNMTISELCDNCPYAGEATRRSRTMTIGELCDSCPYAVSSARIASPERESCGFCSEGTPCICAEVAREAEADKTISKSLSRSLTQ